MIEKDIERDSTQSAKKIFIGSRSVPCIYFFFFRETTRSLLITLIIVLFQIRQYTVEMEQKKKKKERKKEKTKTENIFFLNRPT